MWLLLIPVVAIVAVWLYERGGAQAGGQGGGPVGGKFTGPGGRPQPVLLQAQTGPGSLAAAAAQAAAQARPQLSQLAVWQGGAPSTAQPSTGQGLVAPTLSVQIASAAQDVLARLPAAFSGDIMSLNRQIAAQALSYLAANPTPDNFFAAATQLQGLSSPEGPAAAAALRALLPGI